MKQEEKKFIKTGIIFTIVLIVVFLLINGIYIKGVLDEKISSRQEVSFNEFSANNNQISYAFIGDSHT